MNEFHPVSVVLDPVDILTLSIVAWKKFEEVRAPWRRALIHE